MPSGDRYMVCSPSPSTGPHSPHLPLFEHEQYITELLAERQKIGPFVPVLPCTSRLLNQEILHVSALLGIHVLDQPGFQHGSPLLNGGAFPNGRPADVNGWAPRFSSERLGIFDSPPPENGLSAQGNSSGFIVTKMMRMDIPTNNYPNFNIVGRLLGPRGNSLKRVEAATSCRVLIRGRGSIKDPAREELMRGRPGYEHLDEPLHLVIKAELPTEIIDARLMQTQEILDDMLKPVNSGSFSPFRGDLGMKRAKRVN